MTRVLEIDGEYEAYVQGKLIGTYKTLTKALAKMLKYAKGQNL